MLKIKNIGKQIFNFGSVGITTNLLAFIVYFILVDQFGFSAFLIVLITSPFFILVNFLSHAFFVFKTKTKRLSKQVFAKYLIQYLILYVANLFGIYTMVNKLGWDPIVSQLLVLGFLSMASFIFLRKLFSS